MSSLGGQDCAQNRFSTGSVEGSSIPLCCSSLGLVKLSRPVGASALIQAAVSGVQIGVHNPRTVEHSSYSS